MTEIPLLACWALVAANPYLDRGRELIHALKYPEAVAILEVARQATTSTPEEKTEVLELLARAHAALGHNDRAEASYADLLAADPDYQLAPDASPKLQELFARAKRTLYPPPFVKLDRSPSAPDRLSLRLLDPWRAVHRVVLHAKTRAGEERTLELDRAGAFLSAPVGEDITAAWVVAEGAGGAPVATLGSPANPVLVRVTASALLPVHPAATEAVASGRFAPAPVPAHRPWPAAVAAGLALLAAGTGTALGALSAIHDRDSRNAAAGAPGYFASDARALNTQARNEGFAADGCFAGAALAGAVAPALYFTF